jgi:hypothetical protein
MYYPNINNSSFLQPNLDEKLIMTNVIRCKKKKYITIDTKFFDDNNIHLIDIIKNVSSLKVIQIDLPLYFHNISSELGNNTLFVTKLGVTKKYCLDNFYYTSSTSTLLCSRLSTLLPIDLCEVTFVNNKCMITNKSLTPITVSFSFLTNATTKTTSSNNIGWLLGFRNSEYLIESNQSVVSTSYIDYNPLRYLYLCLEEYSNISNNNFTSYLSSSVIGQKIASRISLSNYIENSILSCNIQNNILLSNTRYYDNIITISRLHYNLCTDDGRLIDLHGLSFSFVLEIEYE